jgi:hypothetical protein
MTINASKLKAQCFSLLDRVDEDGIIIRPLRARS